MSTLKTSISIIALITGLSIGFAPQASFAQNAGAVTGPQAIKDYVEKRDADLAKIDKMMHPTPKPTPTPGPSNAGGTGGTSGFLPTPAPAPAAPSWWDKCFDGACTVAKWVIVPGNMLWDKLDPLGSKVDEKQAQKDHNDAV